MKKTILSHIVTFSIIAAICGYIIYSSYNREEAAEERANHPVIIWNDDIESIPMDGEIVIIEFTRNDTIYIGSIEANR